MKSLFLTIFLFTTLLISSVSAQITMARQDKIAWDDPNPAGMVSTFEVNLLSTNNVAITNSIVPGNQNLLSLTNLVPVNTSIGNYLINLRAKDTNNTYSDYSTNMLINLVSTPNSPRNIRIIRLP